MHGITRREFLKYSGKLATLMGLGASLAPQVADALEQIQSGNAPVIWLQAQSCSGCSVSLLNTEDPGPAQLLTQYISLLFHSNLSASSGELSMDTINGAIDNGGYFLAVEGSIPAGMPEACVVGEEYVTTQILRAAKNADAIIAVGTCAAFGGIPAAENNPTGSKDLSGFLKLNGISKPLINLPGCPAHPDWITGTLVHVIKFGIPSLDDKNRPEIFYSQLIHTQCPRFSDYERERFAGNFSEDGCLFKLGCLGPITYADCTVRHWNSGTNSCIKAGAPCIGCASDEFAMISSFPFYQKENFKK